MNRMISSSSVRRERKNEGMNEIVEGINEGMIEEVEGCKKGKLRE